MDNKSKSMSAPTAQLVRLGDGASITVFMQGESLTLRKKEAEGAFDKALAALKAKNWCGLYEAMRPVKAVARAIDGVTVDKTGVYFNGEPLNNVIATRIMEFANANLDYAPLCAFLKKLMNNPSARAISELYRFLEHSNLPISTSGNFLAYKGIQKDMYSVRSGDSKLLKGKTVGGQVYNGVGEVIEMKRQDVDDDKDRTCSYGLHAGTIDYATTWGPLVVVVEIDPSDVVSIPSDCDGKKLRTCRYKVVDLFVGNLDKPLYESKWEDSSQVEDVTPDEDYDFFADIEFSSGDSAWIESVAWSEEDGTLVIYKQDGGQITHYDVDRDTVVDFEAHVNLGGSAGEFYNDYIKGSF